ncbi:midasin [Wolfiporia cocos MD-104 SS10]|uniref:Midasin n=1 Tax=Wolfiporia cocos (strain MD-104) TaxID=742152 RepID=A0A2H3JCE3_WOLCO|nr:midasin [Wolfiporia cocos MD-104 SS10]
MTPDAVCYDPLAINLKRQTAALHAQIPPDLIYAVDLNNARTQANLLNTLSRLLAVPGLTEIVSIVFRPILLDLCSRWLHDGRNEDDKLEALCLLLEVHPEIFPVLNAFLRRQGMEAGPLSLLVETDSVESVDTHTLQRRLLAYYRILQANRALPQSLGWPLTPLSKLIWTPHPDHGVRYLAVRCYALQSGMMEGERQKLECDVIGEVEKVDCPIYYGTTSDGTTVFTDGWIFPALEVERVSKARSAHLQPPDYYTVEQGESNEPIHPAALSPFVVNVHGVLLLRASSSPPRQATLVDTPTAVQALRRLAIHHSLRLPTLITSAPSSGKSLLLSHLASLLHPDVQNQIVNIHLADTSLDPRSLLGSYASSPTRPGTFEWKEGVLVRAMREGKWVVFEDIDKASTEVLGVIKPLVESLGADKWIGGRALLDVPSRGTIEAEDGFAIYATRSITPSRDGKFASPVFLGAHKFHEVVVTFPTADDLRMIVNTKYPNFAGIAAQGFIRLWDSVRALGTAASMRDLGLRELDKLCIRMHHILPSSQPSMDLDLNPEESLILPILFPNPTLREEMYLEARDVFFGAGATTASARTHMDTIASVVAEHFGLSPERRDWLLHTRVPEFDVEADMDGRTIAVCVGRTRLRAHTAKTRISQPVMRPFAMHRPAIQLLSRIATAVSLCEPVLLTGETGTGKTSAVTHLASLLKRPLVSLNLSNQTESSDLVGGFKPVDARVPGLELQERFLELFGGTFSRKKNAKFEELVRRAVQEGKWKRAVGLWKESAKLAREKIGSKVSQEQEHSPEVRTEGGAPRKRRKLEQDNLKTSAANWAAFERDVETFKIQHVQGNGKFAFAFVEGLLVKALRSGDWILLDEVNLASPETLECVSALLHSPTASITLTEQGSLEPIPRHPDFRLFACMNPATDVGKKDLPPTIRSRFTEIDVPPPDADKETLLSIVAQYIGGCAAGDRGAIMDVAEFYAAVKALADERKIADGANHKPHYSMRTLARALTFAADMASAYSLRRALWEGCLMAFTMVLNEFSTAAVTALAQKHLLAGVRNPRSLLTREPIPPQSVDEFVKFGHFYLERGPLPEDPVDHYIMTPSVETKLIDLARIIAVRRFPVLIEGPTSSGKTSSIEYLAKRTGHRFVRINNHEHTDIQEYLGTYVSDPMTGKLVFKDGLLVQALRNGDWIVLDELNLAPSDVLEALNRLLDDNRELVIPETQEVVRPHPHFMLFATQNPPGLYAGRKVLSRAFRNRFLEVHFEDVPQNELETILCQRCRIAPSHGQRIVSVFRELQKRRQSSRVFESKHGFATLRDLFRWANRNALDYQELAENGYMLLAERARRDDDKAVVKEVIESIMKVRIDENRMYNIHDAHFDSLAFLNCPIPSTLQLVWTSAMQRLFVLLARALRFNEPVLLVGETGCGKTSVCQIYADGLSKDLRSVNCHQNTETADLIGGLRPVRNRAVLEAEVLRQSGSILEYLGVTGCDMNPESHVAAIDQILQTRTVLVDDSQLSTLKTVKSELQKLSALFEWRDGPLVEAMRRGDVFLLDEISLADDSVLERLNSVLEPERKIVLAERGGDDPELTSIQAMDGFKLVATMNPGGDYGKKELSPALRNRFTEIWVPPIYERRDIQLIMDSMWCHESLKIQTDQILDFVDWLCVRGADRSVLSIRDILAWVNFTNAVYSSNHESMPIQEIFHHAAHMTYLDGLGSMAQFSAYSRDALQKLRSDALAKLRELVPIPENIEHDVICDKTSHVQLGPFAISRGPRQRLPQMFSLEAPTTRDNVMRVVRACQLSKPVLLEGSPGVGKTSLIAALANLCGYKLCRINLSDQTDLIDLFGSDLPVEGGEPGQFAWRDAEFLRALQEGHWVLLDEMNLAPQAILEGLNAVLDHRGTVYIPELGRSFTRHPSFRIFAAQNPLHQGGGRKGLPKSFLNRFTKVYVQELTSDDLLLVCQNIFPSYPADLLRGMIQYTSRLNDEIMVKRTFAREGAPWEFNLRDVIRWGTLLHQSKSTSHPVEAFSTVFLQRFRSENDRQRAWQIFTETFPQHPGLPAANGIITSSLLKFGHFTINRRGCSLVRRVGRLLQSRLAVLESLASCLTSGWLAILTGPRDSGKTTLVRLLAHLCGHQLQEISINNTTDATDILGSFEEVDVEYRVLNIARQIFNLIDVVSSSVDGSKELITAHRDALQSVLRDPHRRDDVRRFFSAARAVLAHVPAAWLSQRQALENELLLMESIGQSGRLEWVDGPLVRAVKEGHWLLLDGANLCNPSILDRLNSLCEAEGTLAMTERGQVNGEIEVIKPHPNFRLFMSVDPHYGELSRAMRNRGVEIALTSPLSGEDEFRITDHLRLPRSATSNRQSLVTTYEALRRGLILQSPVHPQLPPHVSDVPSGNPIVDDCPSSWLVGLSPLLHPSSPTSAAITYFTTNSIVPAYLPYLRRFLSIRVLSDELPHILSLTSIVGNLIQSPCNFMSNVRHVAEKRSGESGSPAQLFIEQSLDADSNFGSSGVRATSVAILLSCRLFASLQLDVEDEQRQTLATELRPHLVSKRQMDDTAVTHAVSSARTLLKSIRVLAQRLAQIEVEHASMDVLLRDVLKLLAYGTHLRKATMSTIIDYSATQVIVQWVVDLLRQHPQHFEEVAKQAEVLHNAVSLKSGLGMMQIWSRFYLLEPPRESAVRVREIEAAAVTDEWNSSTEDGRAQSLKVMALWLLPQIRSSSEQEELAQLTKQLLNRPFMEPSKTLAPDGLALIVELNMMSHMKSLMSQGIKDSASDAFSEFIEYGRKYLVLSRLPSYCQMAWAMESDNEGYLFMTRLHKQWFEGVWTALRDEVSGPEMLFYPIELRGTITDCFMDDKALSELHQYTRALMRRSELYSTSLIGGSSRLKDCMDVVLQGILLIAACFERRHGPVASIDMCNAMEYLEETDLPIFMDSFRSSLRSPLQKLLRSQNSRSGPMLVNLGRCFVELGKVMLVLYVPDSPVDPVAMQRCANDFRQEQQRCYSEQIQLHTRYAMRTSGQTNSLNVDILQNMLLELEQCVTEGPTVSRSSEDDLMRLHSFWAEVAQFMAQVVSASKLEAIISDITTKRDHAVHREQVAQDSLAAFVQRLRSAYPGFSDISGVIQLSLLYIKFGLRAIVTGVEQEAPDPREDLISALVAFPTVKSSELLQSHTTIAPISATIYTPLLAELAGIALEVNLGIDIGSRVEPLETLYEQLFGLWLVERSRREEAEREAQSLYRQKTFEHSGALEADMEEQDFLAMFPQFEDVLESTEKSTSVKSKKTGLSESGQSVQLARLHQATLQNNVSRIFNVDHEFFKLRQNIVTTILAEGATSLTDRLDTDSRPFSIALLHGRLSQIHESPTQDGSRNFYIDANVPEMRKALEVLRSLKARLEALIQEWPEQMVLQHIHTRCIAVLTIPAFSPLARMLSALEQLLLNIEDWEMYASRDNTLNAFQQSIITLVVSWRRLELACWYGLLETEARSFADGAREWWFKLYEAVVRGVQTAVAEEMDAGEKGALERYLDGLVPLLDEFLAAAPLGQFRARIDLLASFGAYAARLSVTPARPAALSAALVRVHAILQFTVAYYAQFVPRTDAALAARRGELEKDIHGFIKLASWKDVNVQALRQSAQRTHRQLYKSVHKFREMLRQPITELLTVSPEESSEKYAATQARQVASFSQEEQVPDFPPPSGSASSTSASLPAHLQNLHTTYTNFTRLLSTRVSTCLNALSSSAIDDLSTSILTTTASLAAAPIPQTLSAARRGKLAKALHAQKRRAWADLLKEMKRAGLAENVKPEVLARVRGIRWVREQGTVETGMMESDGGEEYLYRLVHLLPQLRNALAAHHTDVGTRELQRGVMLLESGFALALDSRSCSNAVAGSLQTLQHTISRLRMLRDGRVAAAGADALRQVVSVGDTIRKLVHALEEMLQHLRNLRIHASNSRIPEEVLVGIEELTQSSAERSARLSAVTESIKLTRYPVLLEDERIVVLQANEHIVAVLHALDHWSAYGSPLAHYTRPMKEWLERCAIAHLPVLEEQLITDDRPALIDTLLISMQNVLTLCPAPQVPSNEDEDTDARDGFLREDHGMLLKLARALQLDTVCAQAEVVLAQAARCGGAERADQLARVLPFLARYAELATGTLQAQAAWTRALLKLGYVACTVMLRVAREGFCRPPEGEAEGADGEGAEMEVDGTGIGEGGGRDNVSKEIEEEAQVEGLQGEEENEEEVERAEEGNAIEMGEDIGGKMQDVPEGEEDGEDDDQGSDEEPEEQIGDLDASDPSAVDEKLWGDEAGPKDEKEDGGESNKDHSQGNQQQESEMVAKEEKGGDNKQKDKENQGATEAGEDSPQHEGSKEEEEAGEAMEEEDEGEQTQGGAPIDDHIQEAEILDLPDDMDLDSGKDLQDQIGDEDITMDDADDAEGASPEEEAPADADMDQGDTGDAPTETAQDDDAAGDLPEKERDGVTAQPDLHEGDGNDSGAAQGGASSEARGSESEFRETDVSGDRGTGRDATAEEAGSANEQEPSGEIEPSEEAQKHSDNAGDGDQTSRTQNGNAAQSKPSQPSANPFRSLGDTLREISQHLNDILESEGPVDTAAQREKDVPSQLEYLHPEDSHDEMQALGPAVDEEAAKLSDIRFLDGEDQSADPAPPVEDGEMSEQQPPSMSSLQAEPTSRGLGDNIDSALTRSDVSPKLAQEYAEAAPAVTSVPSGTQSHDEASREVELLLHTWQADGQPTSRAGDIWRHYDALTADLSHALCEQLRLILAPTQATRLRGDYRTGKRLNMKKLIPYVASEYTKDKIWLRRTRPSAREYQVLLALDDSRSMAEARAVHLALQTLALVSRALGRLEVGELAVAKFGERVDVLHGFDGGPFTEHTGASIVDAFRFNQKATQVLSLVETSLQLLEQARDRRGVASATAAELWQLEIIISDGMCQDHERLRTVLRKAEEQRVMVVFIILDSLHTKGAAGGTNAQQNSILNMNQVAYRNVNGKMDLHVERYLDTFPFEYYVVLRDVEALPDVLAGTLKQFFERISEE